MPSPSMEQILQKLRRKYPDARYELNFTNPLELLVATILAAQCTDERVNAVTEKLFKKYPHAKSYARAPSTELEQDIKSTGFYRNKTKAIQGACSVLVDRFNGTVPNKLEQLITLPGVARKTANLVLNAAFGIPSGIVVDTHVGRLSQRMGLTRETKPDRIEAELMRLVPKNRWIIFGQAAVLHGRTTCTARRPKCGSCVLAADCQKKLEKGVKPETEGTSDNVSAKSTGPATRKSGATNSTPKQVIKGKEPRPMKKAAPANAKPSKKPAPAKAKPSKKPAPAKAKPSKKPAPAKAKPSKKAASTKAQGMPALPASWRPILADEINKPYFKELASFVEKERKSQTVFPPAEDVFAALALTPYDKVGVFLLGQDPYHDDGQAHGLCFSVRPGIRTPPSLVNMYTELEKDVGFRRPNHGYLVPWAQQGLLMLNAVLTVRAHSPNSHKNRGWEKFTDAIISKVDEKPDSVVFVLWGGYAQKKRKLINGKHHTVIETAHPSPLSARNGFFGSKVFSRINKALKANRKPQIRWALADL